ncbi:MAG: OmpA family protein [Bradyrhizobiaceae bacterium]|nr:OmpA family protein [Bradyrhizobiaceae bacterium]
MNTRLLLALTSILLATPLTAQWWKGIPPEDVWLTQVGFGAHVAGTVHTADFTLPYAPTCCTEYTTALSFGPALGAFIKQELTKQFRIGLRLSYQPYGATFETDESILVSGNVQGVSRHTLETSLALVSGELLGEVRLGSPLRLIVGASAGQFIQGTFDQKETLIQPGLGTFENGARTRNETRDAELQNLASPYINVVGGIGFDFPLTENHSVMFTPEALLSIGMTELMNGVSWNANQLRVGATIAFALNAPAPPLPIEYKTKEIFDSTYIVVAPDARSYTAPGIERVETDTVVDQETVHITKRVYRTDTVFTQERPVINAKLAVRAKEDDGSEHPNVQIKVTTQFVSEALPLLPVVFFESQALSISFRYHQITSPSEFNINAIPSRTTAVHREVLNILGQRMAANPSSTVTLRGNADPTTELGSCDLATKRAESVKQYLTRVWGIDPARISVASRSGSCAPERATREQSEAGFSENRRVEIETSDLGLLAPVSKRRFNEAQTVTPPALVIDPTGSSTKYVTGWSVRGMSGTTQLFAKQADGPAQTLTQKLSIASADNMSEASPLKIYLHLNAIQGVEADAETEIAVKRDTLATEIQRLTLTLFEVSSDELSKVALEQIRSFVNDVQPGSQVIVRGYADMLGNSDFNRKLSQRRADAVCKEIQRQITKRVELQCTEITSDRFPPGIDSYDTPEERFLSRTVQIEVRKKR